MWILKKIVYFLRELQGTRKCKNLSELVKYIKPGNICGLSFWISSNTWYKYDRSANEEWQDVDTVLKTGKCDCEEKACIAVAVIKTWTGYHADVIVMKNNPPPHHAICVFWSTHKKGFIDDFVCHEYPREKDLKVIIKENYRRAVSFWFTDMKGNAASDEVIL